MDSQEKQKLDEEYITEASPMAAAVGRRIPYHLEYLRRYGDKASGQQVEAGKNEMGESI